MKSLPANCYTYLLSPLAQGNTPPVDTIDMVCCLVSYTCSSLAYESVLPPSQIVCVHSHSFVVPFYGASSTITLVPPPIISDLILISRYTFDGSGAYLLNPPTRITKLIAIFVARAPQLVCIFFPVNSSHRLRFQTLRSSNVTDTDRLYTEG